jgi:hypothetical protein
MRLAGLNFCELKFHFGKPDNSNRKGDAPANPMRKVLFYPERCFAVED